MGLGRSGCYHYVCRYSMVHLEEEEALVEPGGAAELHLLVKSKDKGSYSQRLQVRLNDTSAEEVLLEWQVEDFRLNIMPENESMGRPALFFPGSSKFASFRVHNPMTFPQSFGKSIVEGEICGSHILRLYPCEFTV
jgi:hypothetical protein